MLSSRLLKKSFRGFFNVACEKRGFRCASEIKHIRMCMISPGHPWPGHRLLKRDFQQPAKRPPSWNKPSLATRVAVYAGLAFIHAPVLVIILYAFTTDDRTYSFPLPGVT